MCAMRDLPLVVAVLCCKRRSFFEQGFRLADAAPLEAAAAGWERFTAGEENAGGGGVTTAVLSRGDEVELAGHLQLLQTAAATLGETRG